MHALLFIMKDGVSNFSIDLISALPYLTIDEWTNTLQQAKGCGATHISIYDLQIEDNTAFSRWYSPGVYPLPSEHTGADMYRKAVEVLTSGSGEGERGGASFEHHEVSNYAKAGYRSKHNQKYWSCLPVYGFGMAAASYIDGQRQVRPDNMQEYRDFVNTLARKEKKINKESNYNNHIPAAPDIYEYIMLALRTSDGINLGQFRRLYGVPMYRLLLQSLQTYQNQGKILISIALLIHTYIHTYTHTYHISV